MNSVVGSAHPFLDWSGGIYVGMGWGIMGLRNNGAYPHFPIFPTSHFYSQQMNNDE
jgi:hypothetical protein